MRSRGWCPSSRISGVTRRACWWPPPLMGTQHTPWSPRSRLEPRFWSPRPWPRRLGPSWSRHWPRCSRLGSWTTSRRLGCPRMGKPRPPWTRTRWTLGTCNVLSFRIFISIRTTYVYVFCDNFATRTILRFSLLKTVYLSNSFYYMFVELRLYHVSCLFDL